MGHNYIGHNYIGDQLATTESVAREAGIVPHSARVIELCVQHGEEMEVGSKIDRFLSVDFHARMGHNYTGP